MNKQAIILLHEIYGINKFIEETSQKFKDSGFDVFCPNMIGREAFRYEQSQEAYDHFINQLGFDTYKEISGTVDRLKKEYEKVFIVGFSIGATVAWRCCENSSCDGIVGCYGSRIRDYTDLNPACPTILLFAKQDSFDVDALICKLEDKSHLVMLEFNARHGFIDPYSQYYDKQMSKCAKDAIARFLSEHGL